MFVQVFRRRFKDGWRPLEPIVLLTLIFSMILWVVGLLSIIWDDPLLLILLDFVVGLLLFGMGRWMVRDPLAKTPRVIVVAAITVGCCVALSLSTYPSARLAGTILPALFAVVAFGRIISIILYPIVVLLGFWVQPEMLEQFTGFESGFALLLFLVMWSVREHAAWQSARRVEAATKLQQEQILTTFMRFIAHELRGATAVLSALAPTLHARLTIEPDDWAHVDGQAAYTAYADTTKRINDLLQRLLIITRSGVLSSEQIQCVAIGPLLTEAANEIKALDVPVQIMLEVSPDLKVWGDPAYLSMACTTALRNAAEAMQLSEQRTIYIRALQAERDTVVRIEDSGPGFPPHLLMQLQSRNTENALPVGIFTTKISGTGLGLPLMDRVARLHHGTFTYGNLAGRGAWVQMSLPMREDQPNIQHSLDVEQEEAHVVNT